MQQSENIIQGKEVRNQMEFIDMMVSDITALEEKLHQIHAVSVTARRSLSETLACNCCSESVLTGIFRAIETIAQSQQCESDSVTDAS